MLTTQARSLFESPYSNSNHTLSGSAIPSAASGCTSSKNLDQNTPRTAPPVPGTGPAAIPACDAPKNLNQLIEQLKSILGTKGLSSDEIDINHIKQLMELYESNEEDWGKFALHDSSRPYTRNGVVDINGNANLLILCWSPGKGSAVHDHANAHCCMKVIKGQLMESLYEMPSDESPLKLKQELNLECQEVGYISDTIGLHKISNPCSEVLVSLHLYTPPYASMYGCSMYETNGKKHHVDMSKYYSWQGKIVDSLGGSSC